MNDSALFVLEALLILGLPYVIWHGARARFFVPCAVIQIALGLMIGPSFLGRLSPDAYAYFFSPANLSKISGIAFFSVLLFAFITGVHLDRRSYSSGGSKLAVVGISSVFAPLVLGLVVGWWIFNSNPGAVGRNVEEWRFALAIGVAVSVTALPVLGAILREMQLLRASLGQWVLGLAAINDAALWVLVSVLLVKTGDAGSLWKQLGLFAAYLAFMFAVLRPILQKLFADVNESNFSDLTLAAMASVALGSALVTDVIGLNHVLGAFAAGAIMPNQLRQPILARIEAGVAVLLTPFFFTNAGLHATLDFTSTTFVQTVVVATVVAIVGKVAGAGVPAMFLRRSWREGLAVGALMQTKGLMELVVLTILLEAGLITESLFSALIVMAIITTAIAMPLARMALNFKFAPLASEKRADQVSPGAI